MFSKGDNFHNFPFAYLRTKTSKNGPTLKGKNFAPMEQILSFMRWPQFRGGVGGGSNNVDERVASPESVPFHLNMTDFYISRS